MSAVWLGTKYTFVDNDYNTDNDTDINNDIDSDNDNDNDISNDIDNNCYSRNKLNKKCFDENDTKVQKI